MADIAHVPVADPRAIVGQPDFEDALYQLRIANQNQGSAKEVVILLVAGLLEQAAQGLKRRRIRCARRSAHDPLRIEGSIGAEGVAV